jgi:methyl-accepting chemotaxis protein|tara:strand:+ start:337 stop:720 length:384 start_codon:yes stop_codon:yes gene_type:complete
MIGKNIIKQLNEAIEGTPQRADLSEKKEILEAIKGFQSFEEIIYRSEGLKEVAEKMNDIVEKAERVALQETEEWFDEVTVKRNMKELNSNNKEFSKTVTEINKLQQRLESLYEEMGNNLSRYYEVGH